MKNLACDVLVVGSGAAGATLAATLAEFSSLSIIVLERGGYFQARQFDQRELDMTVLLADRGGRSTVDGAIPVAGGECVGGGTTVNYALSFDPIPAVWDRWRTEYGLLGFSLRPDASDFDIPGLNLANATNDVRTRCNVHTPRDKEVNDNNRLFAEGCGRLGIGVRKFELNMQGCVGCGFCGQGCAYDAKRGTLVTYMRDAVERGVRLIPDCSADRINFEKVSGVVRATGVSATAASAGKDGAVAVERVDVAAKLVIVAAGAIESPALLQRSQMPDPYDRIGRGLVLHPSLPVAALHDGPITNYRGITGSYYSDYFYQEHRFMIECLFDHPIDAAIALPGFGADHFELMQSYSRLGGFGAMLVDTVDDGNRVVWNPTTNKADIYYALGDEDKSRLRVAAEKMVDIAFASGAREAILTSSESLTPRGNARFLSANESALCEKLQFIPNETLVSSAHAQASLKMSENPRKGLLDSRGEVRGVSGCIVCDSSAFPTSCGANPMISIMAMARYQGRRIAVEWRRYADERAVPENAP
jgi:choline dehydrogenase-like flavoprotein